MATSRSTKSSKSRKLNPGKKAKGIKTLSGKRQWTP